MKSSRGEPKKSRSGKAALTAFPPVETASARLLILGSMPSQRSLELSQYYGHPQNAFWRIMGALYGADIALPYQHRVAKMKKCRIAIWDVLHSCIRPGSLDAAIIPGSVVVNDFDSFFQAHRLIRRVYFNGAKAEALYRRHVLAKVAAKYPQLLYQRLPSTSPAHAAMRFGAKLKAWQRALEDDSDLD